MKVAYELVRMLRSDTEWSRGSPVRYGLCFWCRRHPKSPSNPALLGDTSFTVTQRRYLITNIANTWRRSLLDKESAQRLIWPSVPWSLHAVPSTGASSAAKGCILIHRVCESAMGEESRRSAVWTAARLAIFQGWYFLICKKKGPDSMIAKVTSSSVNSLLFKKCSGPRGAHLGFLDNGAQGVFMFDLLPHSDSLL